MKPRRFSGIAAVALMVAVPPIAQAADLTSWNGGQVYYPSAFTWTGSYIGLNVGGAWATGSRTTTLYDTGFPLLSTYYPNTLGTGASGWLGGGQAGSNWQSGAWVFGLETDIDWTSTNKTYLFASAPLTVYAPGDIVNVNATARLNWLATTRARIGFAATPDYRLMVYGTGGLAYGGGNGYLNVFDNVAGLYWHGAPAATRVGWAIGAGVEYAIANNITLRAEYLYYDLGTSNVVTVPNSAANTVFPGVYATAKYYYNGSILRAGVNFKF